MAGIARVIIYSVKVIMKGDCMAAIAIFEKKCNMCGACVKACPFGALEIKGDKVEANASCRMCGICIKNCPCNAITIIDEARPSVNKSEWKGIMVYAEHVDGAVHPVTIELIGKARELAEKIHHPVYCLMIGNELKDEPEKLLGFGVDKVFAYEDGQLRYFRSDLYTDVFEDCINKVKPAIVLVGATSAGRSLAPRVAVRFRTGLTADCTKLEIRDNTDLVQIRPAFGGNIMAQIITPNSRPQFATVRYKVMDRASCVENPQGAVVHMTISRKLKSRINVIKVTPKEKQPGISDAEVLVAGGRGLKERKDLALLEELARLLGGQTAVARPLVEAGWAPYTKQIGLSGRTVKPRLIITCGISGAVQFTAGMNTSECIIAINKDRNAPIFETAHYGIVGDLYDIVPGLIDMIKKEGGDLCGINIKR